MQEVNTTKLHHYIRWLDSLIISSLTSSIDGQEVIMAAVENINVAKSIVSHVFGGQCVVVTIDIDILSPYYSLSFYIMCTYDFAKYKYDLGTRYDNWINQIVEPTKGKTYRLVYHYKKSAPIRATRKGYSKAYPETWKKTDFATCSFSTAATIITWPSIEDINEKMNKEYNHLRYRCNIVVNPVDNTPYQEDNWRKIR